MHTCHNFAAKSQNRFRMQDKNCFKKVPWRLFFFLILFVPIVSYSQENQTSISGQVVDEKAVPMPGVTVTIENGQFRKSAQTDVAGVFRFNDLNASLSYRLTFSHVGYGQKVVNDVRTGSTSPISVSMEPGLGAVGD